MTDRPISGPSFDLVLNVISRPNVNAIAGINHQRRSLPIGLALTLSLVSLSCGTKPRPTASPVVIATEADSTKADLLEVSESQVGDAIERVRDSVVTLEYTAVDASQGSRRIASGVVISDEGDVLSVRIDPPSSAEMGPAKILAHDSDGRKFAADWVAADPETGLTLLKITPGHAKGVVPSPRTPRLGNSVFVIGNPFGLGHSVSRGFVAGLNRRLVLGSRHLGGLIQVDATFHPGDSGALLADLRGGWLGVVRSGLATPETSLEGLGQAGEHDHDLGFAIPARDALWVAEQLKANHRVNRAYLGITMANLNDGPTPDTEGALLDRVIVDTPADLAGLQAGDRILAVDGIPIRSATELTDQLDRTLAETEIQVDLVRRDDPKGARETIPILTAERPTFEATGVARPTPITPPR